MKTESTSEVMKKDDGKGKGKGKGKKKGKKGKGKGKGKDGEEESGEESGEEESEGEPVDPKAFMLDEEPIDDTIGYNQPDHMHFCAREGGNCACDGTVHYGKVDPLGWRDCESDPAACAANLLSHPHESKMNQNADTPTGCNNLDFTDPVPGFAKMCFCEPPVEQKIHRCGLQGEDCHCKGTAFIGKLEIDGVQPAPFASMFELPFFYKEGVTQPFKCEANFFVGSDPFPEVAKQCFCDSSNRKSITEVHSQFEFFQGMLAIQTLQSSAQAAAAHNEAA